MTGLELVAVVLAAVRLMTWRRAAGEVVGSDPARVPHRDLPSGSGRPGFIVPPRAVLDCGRVVSRMGLTSSTRPVGRGGVQRLVPAPTAAAARFAVAEGRSADRHRLVDSTVKLRQDRRMLRRERPLVVAVCGSPGAGKTTVACATARRLGVPFLTRDEIKLGLGLSSASVAKDGGVQLNPDFHIMRRSFEPPR